MSCWVNEVFGGTLVRKMRTSSRMKKLSEILGFIYFLTEGQKYSYTITMVQQEPMECRKKQPKRKRFSQRP